MAAIGPGYSFTDEYIAKNGHASSVNGHAIFRDFVGINALLAPDNFYQPTDPFIAYVFAEMNKYYHGMFVVVPPSPPSNPVGVPVATARPILSGVIKVGGAVSSTRGIWDNFPISFVYQWYSNGSPVVGAGDTYIIQNSDIGNQITATVTASNSAGSGSISSNPTAPVPILAPTNISRPVISGTPTIGDTLTTSDGTWNGAPTGFDYQWLSDGVAVGANIPTYFLSSLDAGRHISVSVIASNAGGSTTATSAAIAIEHDYIQTIYVPQGNMANISVVASTGGMSDISIGLVQFTPAKRNRALHRKISAVQGHNTALATSVRHGSIVPFVSGISVGALLLNEDFLGTSLNPALWANPGWSGGLINGITAVAGNVSVSGSIVSLTNSSPSDASLISTNPALVSPGFTWGYGVIEFYAKLSLHNWWALWTAAFGGGFNSEFDVCENFDGVLTTNYHYWNGGSLFPGAPPPGGGSFTSGGQSSSWLNSWHHFTLRRNTNNTYDIWFDNTHVMSSAPQYSGDTFPTPNSIIIGQGCASPYGTSYVLGETVQVDYVRVWNHP